MSNANFDKFNDIFIYPENKEQSFLYNGKIEFVYDKPDFKGLIDESIVQYNARVTAKDIKSKKDFAFLYKGDNRRYRFHASDTEGGILMNARRMPEVVWRLEQCFRSLDDSYSKELSRHLLSDRLSQGGLIVIAGTPGNGKTTTCAAIIKERLLKHGGHAITVEEPVEMPLHGIVGDAGYCVQKEVADGDSFADGVRDSLRGYPTKVNNILLIGEVRDRETAELAVKSAIDGRLVITTIHAESVIATIKRFLVLLSGGSLKDEQSRDLLATSLRVIMHQNITTAGNLVVSSVFDTDAVCGLIRDTKAHLNQIETEIYSQTINIAQGRTIKPRDINSLKNLSRKAVYENKRRASSSSNTTLPSKQKINESKKDSENKKQKKKRFFIF